MSEIINSACYMCSNAFIDGDLSDDTDYACFSIGEMPKGTRLMLCTGYRRPLRIEYEVFEYNEWRTVGIYYPKHCPNCGREIKEYLEFRIKT